MACLVVGGPVSLHPHPYTRSFDVTSCIASCLYTVRRAGQEIQRRPWSPIGRSRIVLARATETAQTYTQGAHIMEVRSHVSRRSAGVRRRRVAGRASHISRLGSVRPGARGGSRKASRPRTGRDSPVTGSARTRSGCSRACSPTTGESVAASVLHTDHSWSLTSLQQRLVKTGGRLVRHARYYWLLLAESHLTRRLFGSMLRRIWALWSRPANGR